MTESNEKVAIMESIIDSLENGQGRQMVQQIDDYGLYDFWNDIELHLAQRMSTAKQVYGMIVEMVQKYHRIKYR
jgi:hypothetical protein